MRPAKSPPAASRQLTTSNAAALLSICPGLRLRVVLVLVDGLAGVVLPLVLTTAAIRNTVEPVMRWFRNSGLKVFLKACLLPALAGLAVPARIAVAQAPALPIAAAQAPAPPIAAAQAPVPAVAVADDHAALIARMRQAAHVYSQGLEDFLCTKITTRSGDRSGAGSRWKPLDVEESEVRYVEHKETETLLKVNGQSTNLNIKQGYFIPGGEFGASLLQIFSSSVHAQFTFDHQESAGSQQLCVFRYRVPFETSHWGMSDGTQNVGFAHHGMVYADCESGAVMRLHMESEPAEMHRLMFHFPVGERLDVSYRPTLIAGKEFLLPYSAEAIAWYDADWTRAEMQFQNYRKFQSDSRIIIPDHQEIVPDPPSPQPQP
jgi:hypothetical protein